METITWDGQQYPYVWSADSGLQDFLDRLSTDERKSLCLSLIEMANFPKVHLNLNDGKISLPEKVEIPTRLGTLSIPYGTVKLDDNSSSVYTMEEARHLCFQ